MKTPKIQYCFNCGAELGVYIHYAGDIECCGKPECNREMQDTYRRERDEAHEELDRDMGYF